ncbi:hypothetical protein H4R18_004504 [Coemansia javaensis]|uniref:LysM domain-containing protein n=1 Tax=Coemansia javaensis TaxID=2761396 RepID=A0A9W8HAK4_9FUNG|nr:hypothetical protein H4R18_004504 [Coemansia javaensis]
MHLRLRGAESLAAAPWDPWAPPEPPARRPPQTLWRVARRRRADHDPLLCPSPADVAMLARAAARRAEHGLAASIGSALSSPLPRSETHMVGVMSDSDAAAAAAAAHCAPDASQSQSQSPPAQPAARTVLMIRHHIRPTDTLEGISVQYGIGVSQLKRLNRLWQPAEMATRNHLYVPLRICRPRLTAADVEHRNARYQAWVRRGQTPAAPPIDLIELPASRVEQRKTLTREQQQALDAARRTGGVGARPGRQAAVSPRIELMRLKAKATGHPSIAMEDRLYLSVQWEGTATPVFISRGSVVGSTAAQLARQLRLSLLPDRIYRLRAPSTQEPLPPGRTFAELLADSAAAPSLYNGCALELVCDR